MPWRPPNDDRAGAHPGISSASTTLQVGLERDIVATFGSSSAMEAFMHDQDSKGHARRDPTLARRDFLKGAVVGGAAAAASLPQTAEAQQPAPATAAAPASPAGYTFLNPEEAAFVEAMVDHMIPADELTPKGTDVGINIYIDRALSGAWGKGERLYLQGPWKTGVPSQGYQLPLTPAELYRAGIEATNAYCRKTFGKTFDRLTDQQREEVLQGLASAKLAFDSGPPVRAFWTVAYQTVMEGMFSDPIYGGNRNKIGWRMIGFPGVIAVHREHVVQYLDKPFPIDPLSIADMS
jgi:gluconate 2-dehydrogenase gamma chain